jgi:HK97 family phage major capsid protein
MQFIKKSQSEIDAMTPEVAEAYFVAKEAHEAQVQKDSIDVAVKTAKEEVEKSTKKQIDDLTAIVEKQGEEIAKGALNPDNFNGAEAKKELEKMFDATNKGVVAEKMTLKTFNLDSTIAVNSFTGTGGTVAGAIGTIANFFSQVLPTIFRKPVPKSNILDYCEVIPLANNQLVTISETETISIAVTPECTVKPVSSTVFVSSVITATPLATLWKTSDQIRMFFQLFVQTFYNTIVSYFDQKIPAKVIAEVNSLGTAFTPDASQVYDAGVTPTNYDVIIQVIAQLVNLGYTPNCVRMSNYAYSALKTLRATSGDGQYMLQNGGSINLLTSTVSFGSLSIPIETDPSLAVDAFQIGDFTVVKVGLGSEMFYVETLTEADMTNNTKSHRLEKYVAVNIPNALRTGITKDTFANVRALLTHA